VAVIKERKESHVASKEKSFLFSNLWKCRK